MRAIFLSALIAFAAPSLFAQAPMKEFAYLNSLPTYEVIEGDSVEQEFNTYKFFDGTKWQSPQGRFW